MCLTPWGVGLDWWFGAVGVFVGCGVLLRWVLRYGWVVCWVACVFDLLDCFAFWVFYFLFCLVDWLFSLGWLVFYLFIWIGG